VPADSSSTSVPRFWLRVLRSADAAALAISSRDAAVLASLADVRFSLSSSSSSPAEPGASRELVGKRELLRCCVLLCVFNRKASSVSVTTALCQQQ
jgi:hypothetical protein